MEDKKGFTLAEILITLTIIGIVAALTIPTLINNINEAQYTAACKNAYTTLSNAISIIQSNNGGIIHVGTANSNADTLKNDFCNVMTCTQTYVNNIYDQLNYADYNDPQTVTALQKIDILLLYADISVTSLNNGSYVGFWTWTDCSSLGTVGSAGICGGILVDINGSTGPNMLGKDLFGFNIVQNSDGTYSLIPVGSPNDTGFLNADGSGSCMDGQGDGSDFACTYQRLYATMP